MPFVCMIYINSESSLADSSTYSHLHKTPFFSPPIHTVFLHSFKRAAPVVGTFFCVLRVSAHKSFPCMRKVVAVRSPPASLPLKARILSTKLFCDLVVKNLTSFLQFLSQIKTLKQSACSSIVTIRKPVHSQGIQHF